MDYALIEKMSSTAELDRRIAEAQGYVEKLLARREVVAREERARKERHWMGFGEAVEELVGEEVELSAFKQWLAASAGSLRRHVAGHADPAGEAVGQASEPDFKFEPEEPPARPTKGAMLAEAIRSAAQPAEEPAAEEPAQEEPAPVKETPKQVTARVMKEILPNAGLTKAHINELIQAADHGVDFDTIRLIANSDLTLQQVRAARAAAERQVSEG